MMRDVYIVDGSRTPFVKAAGKPNPSAAVDLAVACAKPLLARQPFEPSDLGEVIVGCVAPSADEANIGRIIALRLGCGDKVPGWTVARNCASGLQAIDSGFKDIACGRHNLVLVGGTEAMSRAPLLFKDETVNWLAELNMAKSFKKKLLTILKFRPKFFVPVIALLKGLTDPVVNLNMGQTAEKLAYQFDISREEMDKYAVRSHLRAISALDKAHFSEIEPLFDWQGGFHDTDNGIRPDSSVEKLAKLRPVFDKPFGKVTAGNSSQVTDGSAFLILASESALEQYDLKPLARIKDVAWAGLDPSVMGLGPAHSIAELLVKNNMKLSEIDQWEINEAFAAQVIACVKALADDTYCQEQLGLEKALGEINQDNLNADGGAIAVGHPVGASGARIVLHLMQTLKRQQVNTGVASLCIGGGQGGALLLENMMGGV